MCKYYLTTVFVFLAITIFKFEIMTAEFKAEQFTRSLLISMTKNIIRVNIKICLMVAVSNYK